MSLQERLTHALKRGIIQTQITCPITGEVLDLRTAQFSVDKDGDPQRAFAPEVTEKEISDYLDLIALASAITKARS